jgi:hypothetical protein
VTEIRPTIAWVEAIGLLFFAGIFGGLLALSDTPQVALLFVPLVAAAVRLPMIRVRAEGDRLRVRNFWQTYDVDRAAIAGFLVDDNIDLGGRNARQRTVYVSLRNQRTQRLSATKRTYYKLLAFLPQKGKRNRADDICDQLNAWLRSGA